MSLLYHYIVSRSAKVRPLMVVEWLALCREPAGANCNATSEISRESHDCKHRVALEVFCSGFIVFTAQCGSHWKAGVEVGETLSHQTSSSASARDTASASAAKTAAGFGVLVA